MRIEEVEIYSDATNAAVLRHPGRHYPGLLVQGDTLYTLCFSADEACREIGRGGAGYEEINALRGILQSYLAHYKAVLADHDIGLPFSEQPL